MPVYNFGAGPAMLPQSILREAQAELLNWQDHGISVLEVGHRSPEFLELLAHAEHTLRKILSIPNNYQILFLNGSARLHFAMVPLNFLHPQEQAGYLVTGIWSQKAFAEAQLLKKAYCIASNEASGSNSIPDVEDWHIKNHTSYFYYTPNETVNGIRIPYIPNTQGIMRVADMTSCLLTEPIDISQFALIFAGAQKNIAGAGLTLVIVRDELLAKIPNPPVPTMLNYRIQAEHHSIYATPPVFNCYLAAKMFDWIEAQGGIDVVYSMNCQKAARLYQYLDASDFYTTEVAKHARSIVNICFSLKDDQLEEEFLREAELRNLLALRGHRLVGGIRASIYNSMPLSGVNALIDFMSEFAEKHKR